MRLLKRLLSEIRRASSIMRVDPLRSSPREVMLENFDPTPGYRYGVATSEGRMRISSKLSDELIELVIRREAFIHLLPEGEGELPQIIDLAWAYSEPPEDLWKSCYSAPKYAMFQNYEPFKMFYTLPSRKKRMEALRRILLAVRSLSSQRALDFPRYHYILRRMLAPFFKPTPADNKMLKVLKKDPYASRDKLRRETGLSPASISRSLSRLRDMGFISGPANVDLSKLGLLTLVVTFPNRRELRDSLMTFPFTYRVFEPVSRDVDAHAFLLIPREALNYMESLEEMGLGVYQVIKQKFILNLSPPKNPMELLLEALQEEHADVESGIEVSWPKRKISREDLRVLNVALLKGEVKPSHLKEIGVSSPRYKLRKLKEEGILSHFYTLGVPPAGDDLLLRLELEENQFRRLVEAIGKVSTVIAAYIRGSSWEGSMGSLLPKDYLRGRLVRGLKLLLGDRLILAEDAIDYLGEWTIPLHLWDEEKQRFMWEDDLSLLLTRIRLAVREGVLGFS